MPRPHLLLLVLLAGLLPAAVFAGHGLPPESCSSEELAFHINIIPDPVTAADRAGESCAVVRSAVDSSLAATGDVMPCLCLLDDWSDFLFTGICTEDVPPTIYAPCGGQHVKEAQLLAARCQGILEARRRRSTVPSPEPKRSPPTSSTHRRAPSPTPSEKKEEKDGAVVPRVEEAISINL